MSTIEITMPTNRRPRPRPRRALAALLLGLLPALALPGPPVHGLETDQEEARRTAEDQPADPVVAAVQEALQAAGEGDLEGAISRLEELNQEGDVPPFVPATLGALYVEAEQPERALDVLEPLASGEDADPAALYNAGRAALAVGRIRDAVSYLQRSVERQPGTPAARELGLLQGAVGNYREAYALLRPWVQSHPDDREARRAAALCAIQLQRLPEAEELLSDLSQTEPATGLLWGRLLLLKGEPHAAIGVLQPLLGDAPETVGNDIRHTLAEAYLDVGQSDQAVSVLEDRTGEDPESSLLLAQALYQGGSLERALETLQPFAETVLEAGMDPENPNLQLAGDVTREYGRWLLSAGRNEEAVPYLRLATEAEPREKEAWQALGQALAATGDREEAQEALARFQELSQAEGSETAQVNRERQDREDPTARELRRARELLSQDRPEAALELLQEERGLNPDDPRPWLLESRVLVVLERPEEALDAAEQAVRLAPESPDPYYQRGTVHLAREDFQAAETDLRRALEIAPGHVPALNDLAVLLIVQGERAEAERLLERVLEIRPEDAQARQTLERLRERSG
ncbi:MAG: tetratricopeptide repeat protein [Acidobacteriota bacterium]